LDQDLLQILLHRMNMKFRIFLKSFQKELIQSASQEFYTTLKTTDCQLKGIVALPVRLKKFCVLRSPHVDKDSREQFELRLYKRFIDLITDTPSTLDSLLNVNVPAGVFCSLKVLED